MSLKTHFNSTTGEWIATFEGFYVAAAVTRAAAVQNLSYFMRSNHPEAYERAQPQFDAYREPGEDATYNSTIPRLRHMPEADQHAILAYFLKHGKIDEYDQGGGYWSASFVLRPTGFYRVPS